MRYLNVFSSLPLALLLIDKILTETVLNSLERGKMQCYFNNTNPYEYYSTKTSYFTIENEDTAEIDIPGK